MITKSFCTQSITRWRNLTERKENLDCKRSMNTPKMCKEITTTYTSCPCRIPSVDCCPRCPKSGYKHCVDFLAEEEETKGVCVGLGTCPAEVEVKFESKDDEKEREWVGLGAIDWGEVFGLVGSSCD
jgi:hypothetical protein